MKGSSNTLLLSQSGSSAVVWQTAHFTPGVQLPQLT